MGSHEVEFRRVENDAWYIGATILLNNNNNLVVKFLHNQDYNLVFEADQFKSLEQVEDIEKRFRPLSIQLLQHNDCRFLTRGTLLSVSHSSPFRFYDAILDDVVVRDHRFEKECTCEFLIAWKHGPCSGESARKRAMDIRIVQPRPLLDPKVAAFFTIVKRRLQNDSRMPPRISTNATSVSDPASPNKKKISDHICTQNNTSEDIGMGSDKRCNLILIENLDRDLSSSTIVEFIRKETSIAVEACIFPSLSSMSYHGGIISVDCQRNLEKLCALLDSVDCIVVSNGGRPCVVTGKLCQYDLTADPILASMLKYQDDSLHRNLKKNNGLKVVYSGSEEYKTAVQLKGIFLEFAEHQKRMQKGLAMEESLVLQSSKVS